MNKKEIAESVYLNSTLTKEQAMDAVDCVFNAIAESLNRGENVYLRGFGTFQAVTTQERHGRDIGRGLNIRVPAGRSARLKASRQLKRALSISENAERQ